MKRIAIAVAGLALLVVLSTTAFAEPFDFPPEQNAPGWVWGFPYQRNILWSFDTDPRSDPSPGNGAHYEGQLDPLLWDSDYVELTGDVGWLQGFPPLPPGLVGIFNTAVPDPLTGQIIFHIDNTLWPLDYKNIWLEYDFVVSSANVEFDAIIVPGPGDPLGYVVDDWTSEIRMDPTTGLLQQNAWVRIEPNPFWEDFVITLSVPQGEFAFLDQMHIATECIPEPASLTLFGLGLAGLAFCWYRRRAR